MITKLILPDGTSLSSGTPGQAAILSFSHTESVNSGQELEPGGCCAAMIRAEILGAPPIQSGMELVVWRGQRLLGRFTVQEAVARGGRLSITAYDGITRLDRDLTHWLAERSQWPISMAELTEAVCEACGLETATVPDSPYMARAFTESFVTGRQLLQWIGQVCGCFFRVNGDGRLECGWYSRTEKTPDFYYRDSLCLADYEVQPVQQVRLIQSAADVGVQYPLVTEQVNTYILRSNPLLAAHSSDEIEPVARSLYDLLQPITYTPCTVTVGEDTAIRAGDIITVMDKTVYVMTAQLEQGRLRLSCTGSKNRSDSANVTISSKELNGRVLELNTRMDGLTAENRDSAGKLSRLSMTVEGLTAEVTNRLSADDRRLTKLEQTADALNLHVQQAAGRVVTDTGYTFDAEGLKIARSGTDMVNCLDHSGMYVRRAGETILQADSSGVVAADVQVRNFLHVGSHARFEDYAGRTACFYIGE